MKLIRGAIWLLLIAGSLALAGLPGCVELTDQRLSIFYDKDTDQLRLLLFYDGIHEGHGEGAKGADQIPPFIADGDILLLDWIGHIKISDLKDAAKSQDPGNPTPAEREFLKALLAGLKTEAVGRYRDTRGRIGAAQLITIAHASEVIKKANAAISGMILDRMKQEPLPQDGRLTLLAIAAAAEKDYQWIALDGQAVRLSLPVHDGEWQTLKAAGISALVMELVTEVKATENRQEDTADALGIITQLVSTAHVSYAESAGLVTLVIGEKDKPTTLRCAIDHPYNPDLETVVEKNLAVDLDRQIAAAILNPTVKPDPAVAAVLQFGPPEMPILALLNRSIEEKDQASVVKALQELGRKWNAADRFPPSPQERSSAENYLDAWTQWRRDWAKLVTKRSTKDAAPDTQPADDCGCGERHREYDAQQAETQPAGNGK